MHIPYDHLRNEFRRVVLKNGFGDAKSAMIAEIFAANSRDGVHTHGLNRFPVFIRYVKEGLIDVHAEPEAVSQTGLIEHWDGHLAAGVYNASLAMSRAIVLAKVHGIGVVTLRNTNHWMRGGTYGWQAAEAGCIGICMTNAIAIMPPWGGTSPTIGNNPLVMAIPHQAGHVVLDMALSQYSYGKMQEYKMDGKALPLPGGYDENGALTTDPEAIMKSKRPLPIGYWKGSGLSIMVDLLVAGLSGGRSVSDITASENEYGVSQLFIAINAKKLSETMVNNILAYTKSSAGGQILYPGERVLEARKKSLQEGVYVNDQIWEKVCQL